MKWYQYLILIFIATFGFSCQNDEEIIITDDLQNLKQDDRLIKLLGRVAQNPTSKDNILDNSSCFRIQLPVNITVNNKPITVVDQTDYKRIEEIINNFSDDDDKIVFTYPLTIEFRDFTKKIIYNADELEDIVDDCEDELDFDEIECFNIQYPIKINSYNSINQIATTITILNDKEFYNSIDKYNNNNFIISLQFPISVVNANATTNVVYNNKELELAIEATLKSCNNISEAENKTKFISFLTEGIWQISYYFDSSDLTNNFKGYEFLFKANQSVVITKGDKISTGEWSTTNLIELELDFEADFLENLEDDWEIVEFNQHNINLKKDNKRLSFKRK